MKEMDYITTMLVMLFILSMITEKLVQLVKSYPKTVNLILILLSFGLLVRRIHTTYIFNTVFFNAKNIVACSVIVLNLMIIVVFSQKDRISKHNKITLLLVSIINATLVTFDNYNWYIFVAYHLLFLCLTAFRIIPVLYIQIGKNVYSSLFYQNVRKKHKLSVDTIERTDEISMLSFVTGILIAFLFEADFMALIRDLGKNENLLTWGNSPIAYKNGEFLIETQGYTLEHAFGIVLTGFFLSFGSKFFHDLLELLFYAKKARSSLLDGNTFRIEDADKLQAWVENYDTTEFYRANVDTILKYRGCTGVGLGQLPGKDRIIGLRINCSSEADDIKHFMLSQNINGTGALINFEIFTESGYAHVSTGRIEATDAIRNKEGGSDVGSVTFPVELSKRAPGETRDFVITCFHVVKHESHPWNGAITHYKEVENSGNQEIGEIIYGKRHSSAEIALIRLNEGEKIGSSYYPGGKVTITGEKVVSEKDVGKKVFMYSRRRDTEVEGILMSHDCTETIYFDELQEKDGYAMYQLLAIATSNNMPIQEDGDSGNLLFDEDRQAIGIVFAKSKSTTYAMRIDLALSTFKRNGQILTLKQLHNET